RRPRHRAVRRERWPQHRPASEARARGASGPAASEAQARGASGPAASEAREAADSGSGPGSPRTDSTPAEGACGPCSDLRDVGKPEERRYKAARLLTRRALDQRELPLLPPESTTFPVPFRRAMSPSMPSFLLMRLKLDR